MKEAAKIQYWLFQSNPRVFNLKAALRAGLFFSFPVKQHKKKIQVGDKVIIWQTGDNAGVYALCTVVSPVSEGQIYMEEAIFFLSPPDSLERVELRVDYNLWNKPITKNVIPENKIFDRFYAGLSGTNYKATKKQFNEIISLIQQFDLLNEPVEEYVVQKSAHLPLNLVLYGPPGTGKTYHTVNYALAIIENRSLEEISLENRVSLLARFEEYVKDGMISFVTFHQSTSYEDFVEGIKPHSENGQISYRIENGIFKQICLEAKRHLVESLLQYLPSNELTFDFNQLYKGFLNYLKGEDFEFFTNKNNEKIILHKIARFGNVSVRTQKSFSIYTVRKTNLRKLYKKYQNVQVIEDVDRDIRATIGAVNTNAYWSVFTEIKEFEKKYIQELSQNQEVLDETVQEFDLHSIAQVAQLNARKHVLIIDEINRGNVAAIFGELITLIEPDKREGMPEAMNTILPYSKNWFAVPPNIHLLCTMNTADRSVEALDTALRRRFTFVEMKPNAALVRPNVNEPMWHGVDLEKMLLTINRRIELLLNKEYAIGHAYFMNVKNFDDLKEVFATKIIPLLEEYFYGDYAKVGLVLGNSFVKQKTVEADNIFANFDYEYAHDLGDKVIYRLEDIGNVQPVDFIRIYDGEYEG